MLASGHGDIQNEQYYFVAIVVENNQVNQVNEFVIPVNKDNKCSIDEEAKLWHRRFKHLAYGGLQHQCKKKGQTTLKGITGITLVG